MILLDSDIFLYAAGRPSAWRDPCQGVLRRLVEEEPGLVSRTDAAVLRELLEHGRAVGAPATGRALFDAVAALGIPILPLGEQEMRRGREILDEMPAMDTRVAAHAGIMRANGIERVLSYDEGFDAVPGIERLEPWAPEGEA